MTDTSLPTDDTPADTTTLRDAVTALTARLDRIEAQAAQPSLLDNAQTRLTGAWDALRGGPAEPVGTVPTSKRRGLLWPVLTVCAVLLALILAVELTEEVFDGFRHLGRWIN